MHQKKCKFRERTWRVVGTDEKTRLQKFGSGLKKLQHPIEKIAEYYLNKHIPGENPEELEKNEMHL